MRHVKSGRAVAAVDDHADGDGIGSVGAALRQRFEHTTAAGDDVFDDEHFFVGREFEIAAQGEFIVDLLKEDEAQAELAGDLLPDHESAHRGADHCGRTVLFEHRQHDLGEASHLIHVLADLGALKKMRTVQPRAKKEMPLEERSAVFENLDNFVVLLRFHTRSMGAISLLES